MVRAGVHGEKLSGGALRCCPRLFLCNRDRSANRPAVFWCSDGVGEEEACVLEEEDGVGEEEDGVCEEDEEGGGWDEGGSAVYVIEAQWL